MPRLKFKKFSDLAFIQAIDKPQFLVPLLASHQDFFARQGLGITGLKNDNETDRRLLRVFTQPDEEMPAELLDALYQIDDLSDEAGHDRIWEEARRQGVDLNGASNLGPGDFALAILHGHPGLIQVCHGQTLHRKIKHYQEYQGKGARKLSIEALECHELEEALGRWFESRNRSRACEIYVYREDQEIKFLITHGRLLRTEGSIDKRLKRSRVAYRPQKHDFVVYDNRTCILKINAQTASERDLYRETIGNILFGDSGYFPAGDIYTLSPLKRLDDALRPVSGVESIRLSEVWMEIGGERMVQISKGKDLVDSIKRRGRPNLDDGQILRASFLLKYTTGGRARRLEVRPPNVAVYDHERDGLATEAFMGVNGYMKVVA